MRPAAYDSTIKFRANSDLLASAAQRASSTGTTLSELIRHALRREIGAGLEPRHVD